MTYEVENERPGLILHSETGNNKAMDKNQQVLSTAFPDTPEFAFTSLCGDFPTSSGFALWFASLLLKEQRAPVWMKGYNVSSEKYIHTSTGRFTSQLLFNFFPLSNRAFNIFSIILILVWIWADKYLSIGAPSYGWLLLIYVSVLFCGSYFIRMGFFLKSICSVKTNEKWIALSFDDGPAGSTSQILDILKG